MATHTTVHDLLLGIHDDLVIHIVNMKNAKSRNACINNDMAVLNTTSDFFTRKCQEDALFNNYITFYSKNEDGYANLLSLYETILAQIKDDLVQTRCSHVWLEDWVDVDPDTSHKIQYCSKCKMTSKC